MSILSTSEETKKHRALRGGSDSAFQNSIPSTSLSYPAIYYLLSYFLEFVHGASKSHFTTPELKGMNQE